MKKPKIFAHGSYIGGTGYNNHTRDFFRQISKYFDIKLRNFTVGSTWQGHSDKCHDNEDYINDVDKKILYKQILWTGEGTRDDFPIYSSPEKEFDTDINIILNETNHHLYYEEYNGPKIAYNVWESTLQPTDFFNKLKEFDELWVPSKWQKECTIAQGYPEDKIKVVPEGVDVHTFYPDKVDLLDEYKDGRFKFLLFGRWDYRKSTKEIIQTFLKTFSEDEPVDLVVSIDNMWGDRMDGYKTTEERLEGYGLLDPRIKIVHFPKREDYIKFIKTGHIFLSCARSEGWNLPLIEAMACGTPSIYSNCCAQLEFAKDKGLPVNIVGLKKADANDYARFKMSDLPGDYYEPDFSHLSEVMRYSYENYEKVKEKAVIESEDIRKNFSWERIGEIGRDAINKFYEKINDPQYINSQPKNEIHVSYLDGPKVEILGKQKKEYEVEFIDQSGVVRYSSKIKNNMWTKCSIKYYVPWTIKVDGEVVTKLDLKDKEVLICLESKALGDTIAWTPYAVKFAEKHNCKLILSTFHNSFFEKLDSYKNIKFIKPGQSHSCTALYRIGWFKKNGEWNDTDKNPNQVNIIPLQQTATDILGLEFEELNYGLDFKKGVSPIKKPYVVFGPNATAGCKEWIYEHWVDLAKLIKKAGYEVVSLTKHPHRIDGVININNKSMDVVANYLHHAKAYIGLGSGLSWFNWALGKHTYMVNGFAKPNHEFTSNITKIYNENTCIFCWNDEVFVFDPGDWNWCPVYKGTKKQHICQKNILPEQVFKHLNL